jgi:beta-glucosidase
MNRWYLDPIMGRDYPIEAVAAFKWDRAEVKEGDMEAISTPIDFLGVNYYTRQVVSASGVPRPPTRVTDMGWEVYPDGLSEILDWIWSEYGVTSLYVTENGAAYDDDPNRPTHDPQRVEFLRDHLAAAARSLTKGVPLEGYFAWSLLDNFEWGHGHRQRFGIVRVDFETQERTPRDSARYWSEVAATGEVDPPGFDQPA